MPAVVTAGLHDVFHWATPRRPEGTTLSLPPGHVEVNKIDGVKGGRQALVGTGTTALLLERLKPAGSREMSGLDFCNGLREGDPRHFG